MDKLIITGGRKLKGKVNVSGAKNAALPCMAAVLLAEGEHKLFNVPQVADIKTMARLLSHIGIDVNLGNGFKTLKNSGDYTPDAPYEIVKTMRASSLVLGPMLAKCGQAKVSLPGGCAIGARPLNLHLKALEAMGVEFTLEEGYIFGKVKKLTGASINFDTVTVTGTENIMMAATLAKGTTVIENAAREPEVTNLAEYLIQMGAKIEGAGTDKITIEGVESLKAVSHNILPDRIEAGTFACAAAITGGEIEVQNCPKKYLDGLLVKLESAGCTISETNNGEGFCVKGPSKLVATDVTTAPFPAFATDLQAQMMAVLAIAKGTSIINETIFENRFMHVQELLRLGADIKIEGHTAIVQGVDKLNGAEVMATDLRASASLVLAALSADGVTNIHRIYHLDRGYEKLDEKLKSLGANIERGRDQ